MASIFIETACCSLPNLLNKNAAAIQKLFANDTSQHSLDANIRRALAEIARDPTMAKGERNCWSLGDLNHRSRMSA